MCPDTPAPVRFLNLGGGFGVPYFPGETRLDIAPIGAHLHTLDAQLARQHPPRPQARRRPAAPTLGRPGRRAAVARVGSLRGLGGPMTQETFIDRQLVVPPAGGVHQKRSPGQAPGFAFA